MTELRIERTIAATPERVWRAFTTTELGAWLWPTTWNATCEVDARVGGRYRIAAAAMAVGGEFVALDEPHRIVQTWQWDGEPNDTLVTITIEPREGGTALTIVHERFESADDSANHLQGWNDCLARLEPYLAS